MRALPTLIVVIGLLAGPAVAQPEPGEDTAAIEACAKRAAKISGHMMSPICRGKTLQTCTSPGAQKIRMEMQEMCMAGSTDDHIIEVMDARYGAKMRAEFGYDLVNPEQPWYSAFLPMIPFAVGALILGIVGWQWRRRSTGPQKLLVAATPTEADADADRLARLRRQIENEDE